MIVLRHGPEYARQRARCCIFATPMGADGSYVGSTHAGSDERLLRSGKLALARRLSSLEIVALWQLACGVADMVCMLLFSRRKLT
jgi:hypothetical protein